ncbi:unnamed protein product [Pleuronectes platessa]|uniref:Uncharacterized protein n=1 Tax=Pleuronectes platessa TaxID=8262 RepID=A0A9N7VED7_PLEPL|nr:unnamed protein product [Pleuronectes platessa]
MPHSPRPVVVPAPILVPALYGRCLIALVRKRGICDWGSVKPNNNTGIDNNNHRLMNDCRDGEGDRRD